MGAFGIWHWLIVFAVILLLFGGRGRISALMGEVGDGLASFRKTLRNNENKALGDDVRQAKTEARAD